MDHGLHREPFGSAEVLTTLQGVLSSLFCVFLHDLHELQCKAKRASNTLVPVSHRIMEYLKLEGTHKDHRVQLPACDK